MYPAGGSGGLQKGHPRIQSMGHTLKYRHKYPKLYNTISVSNRSFWPFSFCRARARVYMGYENGDIDEYGVQIPDPGVSGPGSRDPGVPRPQIDPDPGISGPRSPWRARATSSSSPTPTTTPRRGPRVARGGVLQSTR
jgi:hypothetical protein